MPLLNSTVNQLRASGWSEEKIAEASKRKDQREENGRVLDEFVRHRAEWTWGACTPAYDDCKIERTADSIYVHWHDPEHMKHCLSPRVFQVFKVNKSYAFEEV